VDFKLCLRTNVWVPACQALVAAITGEANRLLSLDLSSLEDDIKDLYIIGKLGPIATQRCKYRACPFQQTNATDFCSKRNWMIFQELSKLYLRTCYYETLTHAAQIYHRVSAENMTAYGPFVT
jgi:hypothetical protein